MVLIAMETPNDLKNRPNRLRNDWPKLAFTSYKHVGRTASAKPLEAAFHTPGLEGDVFFKVTPNDSEASGRLY